MIGNRACSKGGTRRFFSKAYEGRTILEHIPEQAPEKLPSSQPQEPSQSFPFSWAGREGRART